MTEHTDGRLVLKEGSELYAAANVVSEHFTSDWLKKNQAMAFRGSKLSTSAAAELIVAALQAVNVRRLGQAEESIARHPDGRTARRYYSDKLCKLRWLITNPPSDGNVDIDAIDELPDLGRTGSWEIVYNAPWKVH